jgi:hypothetical protein
MKGKNMKNNSTISEKTETKMLNTRIQKGLIKRVKVFCAEKEINIQDFVTDAVIEKLELAHKERRKKPRL